MSHSLRAVKNSLDYTKPNYWIRLLLSVIFITLVCLVCDLPHVIKSLSLIESIGFIIAIALFTADFVLVFLPVTTQWLRVNKLPTKVLEVPFSVFSFLIVYSVPSFKNDISIDAISDGRYLAHCCHFCYVAYHS